MASHKRGGGFNHYGRDHHNKKHQQFPQHRNAPQPELSSKDMQTGLVALLDRFVAEETMAGADKETLYYAHELRRRLCDRDHGISSQAKRDLDKQRPDKAVQVAIPDYVHRKVCAAKDLPPLPPISEPHLHEAVFTHRSAIYDPSIPGSSLGQDLSLDYERLELLGDAYIELIASRALYNRFPHVDVPELCMWRERLVENSTLGKFSEAYGFPDRLKHRAVWDKNSKQYHKVVADMVEAYVAAVVLSDPTHGFETAEAWLTELWAPQLLSFREKIIENPQARDQLNKLVLGKDVKLITKEEKPMTYDSNSVQCYHMGIYLTGWGYHDEWLGSGDGQNKVQAGVAAAADALKRDSPVLRDAIRQKNELRAIRLREQEEKVKDKQGPDHPTVTESDVKEQTDQDTLGKKRKKQDEPTSPEQKKHKKEKKDKKRKPSNQESE
jgi:ribonuclease-3